jgi:hypothetical protein
VKEENIDINEIMKIEQMPIVFEQLEKIGALIEESTKDLDKLECTEENKQEVKKRRTEINNTLKVLEDRRKEIKTKLLEPYNVFNEKYENECKTKLENASNVLKEKIDTIESEQLKEKEQELREFAEQHIIANNIQDIITFEDIGLNITLSASIKSLKEQILDFINKIVSDLKLIEMEEYKDEILLEYNETLDFAKSKMLVVERHKQLEELKKQQEEKLEQEKQEEQVVEKVDEAIEEVSTPKEIIENDELITVSFTITDTKEKILKLRDYLKENEINYE